MEYIEPTDISSNYDDLNLLLTAIYQDMEMAALVSEKMPFIKREDMADALFFAAMGAKNDFLKFVQQEPVY